MNDFTGRPRLKAAPTPGQPVEVCSASMASPEAGRASWRGRSRTSGAGRASQLSRRGRANRLKDRGPSHGRSGRKGPRWEDVLQASPRRGTVKELGLVVKAGRSPDRSRAIEERDRQAAPARRSRSNIHPPAASAGSTRSDVMLAPPHRRGVVSSPSTCDPSATPDRSADREGAVEIRSYAVNLPGRSRSCARRCRGNARARRGGGPRSARPRYASCSKASRIGARSPASFVTEGKVLRAAHEVRVVRRGAQSSTDTPLSRSLPPLQRWTCARGGHRLRVAGSCWPTSRDLHEGDVPRDL